MPTKSPAAPRRKGRPPITTDARRSLTFKLRISAEDRQRLEHLAQSEGVSASAWLLRAIQSATA